MIAKQCNLQPPDPPLAVYKVAVLRRLAAVLRCLDQQHHDLLLIRGEWLGITDIVSM
jgi:hypothetical protein